MITRNGHWNGTAKRTNGNTCRVRINESGLIVASSAVSCTYTGTERFHRWFCERFRVWQWQEDADIEEAA